MDLDDDNGPVDNVIQMPVQRRARAASDGPKGASLREDRATIDGGAGRLDPARAARAADRNARLVAMQGLTPADLGIEAAPHTIAFAHEVARLQAEHGLEVDGIAGPVTAAALAGGADAR